MTQKIMTGIILKTIDYQESSKIIYLLTNEGKVSLLVKGANKIKSEYRSLAQTLTLIEYAQSTTALPFLIHGRILSSYQELKEDYDKMIYAMLMIEIIYKVNLDEVDFIKLFSFVNKCLKYMMQCDQEIISFIFELKLLALLGVAPQFKVCHKCGSEKNIIGFDLSNGSVVCTNCTSSKLDANLDITILLLKLYYFDLDKMSLFPIKDEDKKQIRQFIDKYYLYHLGYVFKTKEALKA